jgi:o-succinylbenzoate synthase
MRLSSVEVIPYALPFKDPYVTARGVLERREMVLLRVRDEEGAVGLGEAVPLSLRGGGSLAEVVQELDEWGSRRETYGLSAPARCAADIALQDLRWKRRPPGTAETPVRCNATLIAGETEALVADAQRWAQAGFTTFKMKLGAGWDDVAQVRAVREVLGPDVRIRIDVNASWDLEMAKSCLRRLDPLQIELAEQPVGSLEAMAELAASTSIPLAADESVASLDDAERAKRERACAYTGIKLSKVGGPEAAMAIADVLPAYVSSALDGPVGIAAAARIAQTLGGELAHGLATQRLFAETIAAVECELRGGMLHLPPGPGLGVEIDEEALQAHRI